MENNKLLDFLDQLESINKMIDLHSENETKFMYEQYKYMRDKLIEEMRKSL
jgi:hypothetical protein